MDDDVMKQVNRKMDDMMKTIMAQQAEIAKFKQNEEKMLQIVVASKSNQDEINEKVKKLEAKNEKLEGKCARNKSRIKLIKADNKELRAENKRLSDLIDDLYNTAPKLKEGEEDKEEEEEKVDYEDSESDEEKDDDEDDDESDKNDDEDDNDDDDDAEGSGRQKEDDSESDDDDDGGDDTSKFTFEERTTKKKSTGESSSKKKKGENVDSDESIFWNEKVRSLSDDAKQLYKDMLEKREWTIEFTGCFTEIFQTDDMRYELEYEDPDLEEGELPASVAKEILDGLAQRVGKTFEEFMMDESIPDIPEKDMGSHSDDVHTPENNEVEIEDITHEEFPQYFRKDDENEVFPDFTEIPNKSAIQKAKKRSEEFVEKVFGTEKKDSSNQSDELKNYMKKLKEMDENRPKPEAQGNFYRFHNAKFKGRALGWTYLGRLKS